MAVEPHSAVQPASAAAVFNRAMHDFDEFALAFANWDAEFRQLSRGAFSGRLQVFRTGGVEVLRVQGNQVIRARGVQRQPRWMFVLVPPSGEGANWRGQLLHQGQMNVVDPGGVMDHRSAATIDYLCLSVHPDVFRDAAELQRIDVDGWPQGQFALAPSPPALARLEGQLRRRLRAAECPTADFLTQPAGAVEDDCLGLLFDAMLGSSRPSAGEERGWWQRRSVARRAEEYVEAHLHRPRSVRAICAELDVSERTLEAAFLEQFGLGPLAFYKARRLNAVREQLKRATSAATPLHAVARQWGFRHTGAFAADYRRQFGELPSETVRGAQRAAVGLSVPAARPPGMNRLTSAGS